MCMWAARGRMLGMEAGSEHSRSCPPPPPPPASPGAAATPGMHPEAFSRYLSHPESECQGDPVRDFHQVQRGYAICQTTRPLSWVECRGSCRGSGCCRGLRLKRRKLTFECSDGTSFAEEVEKPSKCGCTPCA